MSAVRVVPLRQPDEALQQEAETAARIVSGIRGGDSSAESELVERYSRGLGFLLNRRIGDAERARDLLQETFCIALEKLRSQDLENPERLAGYLRGIAVRVAMNAGRKREREPYPVDNDVVVAVADPEPPPYRQISAAQTGAAVRKLLDGLAVSRDRELLLRLYVYDEDKDAICAALGLDSLHFNRVLYRAKQRFRRLLEGATDAADLATPETPA